MGSDRPHCVLVVDGSQPTFQATARWLTIIASVGLTACLLVFGSIYLLCWMYPGQTTGLNLRALPLAFGFIVVTWAIIVGGLRLGTRYLHRTRHMVIGADFLMGPGLFFWGIAEVESVPVRFTDIRSVSLDISKGRVTGAIVRARHASVPIRKMKEPETVVRTVLERTGPEVTWRRSAGLCRPRLNRDHVRGLIEDSGGKDIDAVLPPGHSWVTADEFLSKSQPQEILTLRLDPPTPAERYVNLLLLEMSRDGLRSRTLKRSETLPPIRRKDETVEPPPVDDVVNRLRFMCALKPKKCRKPVDGTIHLTTRVSELGPRSFKFTCRFDDRSDACCTIHLETGETRKDG